MKDNKVHSLPALSDVCNIRAEVSFADGFPGQTMLRLVTSGCERALSGHPCDGCHNPELWQFGDKDGIPEIEAMVSDWNRLGFYFSGVSIVGGEPLDLDIETAARAIGAVRKMFQKDTSNGVVTDQLFLILFTGYEMEEVQERFADHPFVMAATYIKCGQYVKELSRENVSFPTLASSNQRLFLRVSFLDGIGWTQCSFAEQKD